MPADGQSGDQIAIELRFPLDVYSLDTVKKAAYRFTDRCTFEFVIQDKVSVCQIKMLSGGRGDISELADDFRNEVLDQDLRQKIADETADVRNAVLAYAFSKTDLQSIE